MGDFGEPGGALERLERIAHGAEPIAFSRKTPLEIATTWYNEDDIERSIKRKQSDPDFPWDKIPEDVESPEFARWLTQQYRLAMAKGVQLGRDKSED